MLSIHVNIIGNYVIMNVAIKRTGWCYYTKVSKVPRAVERAPNICHSTREPLRNKSLLVDMFS